MTDFIYLASQSPRRRQLLDQLGVRHELLLPHAAGEEAEDAEGLGDEAPADPFEAGAAVANLGEAPGGAPVPWVLA